MSLPAAEIEPPPRVARDPTQDEVRAELRRELDRDLLSVEHHPNDADAWTSIAVKRTRLGMYHDAVNAFDHVTRLVEHPDEIVWYGMAVAATRSGDWDQALRAFEALTETSPEEPVWWIFKSMALTNLGRHDDADSALRQAADVDASDPGKIVAISFAVGLLGRYDEALALDERAIEQARDNAYAYANKGTHLAKKSLSAGAESLLVNEAVRAFEKAVDLLPDDPNIRRNYGVMLGEVHRYRAAEEQLEQAQRIVPENVATLRSLGYVYTKLAEQAETPEQRRALHERALEADSQAVTLAPHYAVAWRSKGVDLLNLERYEEARYAFEEASKLTPERAEMWQAQGSVLWRLGLYKEAATAFERVTLCDAEIADAWLGLGASRDALGQHELARNDLRKAVGAASDRSELWAALGRTYRHLGDEAAAEHAYRRGFEIERSLVMASGVIDTLAAQDREGDALEFLKGAKIDDPDDAMLAYFRGVLLMRLGRESEAVAEFAIASHRWKKADVHDARAATAAEAVEYAGRQRGGAVSWTEHWFGRGSETTTRVIGAILLCALLAAVILPLAVPGVVGSIDYGAAWAALTLPVTVLVLLLALPTVQSIKAGGGSFELTTIVQTRDALVLALPSKIEIDKIPDIPVPDVRDALATFTDQVGSFLDFGDGVAEADPAPQPAGTRR